MSRASLFGFDLRSLAAFRFLGGIVLALELRSPLSLLAVAFALGWETFWVTPILAALLWLTGAHPELFPREYVFWSVFLPVGALFSVDRALHPKPPALPRLIASIATVGVMLQLTSSWAIPLLLVALAPSRLWEWLGRKLSPPRMQVWFDGECGLCRKLAGLVLSFGLLEGVPLRPAQERADRLELMERENSWILERSDGTLELRYDAFLGLAQASPLWRWASSLLRLRPIRRGGEALYRWVAQHRSRLDPWLPARRPRRLVYAQGMFFQIGLLCLVILGIYRTYRELQPEVERRVFELLDAAQNQ